MNAAEGRAVAAVREVLPKVARCVDEIAALLREGGRLHYFGAGTSGRTPDVGATERVRRLHEPWDAAPDLETLRAELARATRRSTMGA